MDYISDIRKAIVDLKGEETISLTKKAIESGMDPVKVLEEGLVVGMRTVGDKFENFEYFLPDLMIAADIMTQCSEIVSAALPKAATAKKKPVVVIGTAAGDIHNIGKNLVSTFFTVGGFEVHNIGEDVTAKTFTDKAKELNADIIAVSALMSTSMGAGRDVVKYLEDAGLREKYKVMLGGGPVTEADAERFGADGWAVDALGAVPVAKRLTGTT